MRRAGRTGAGSTRVQQPSATAAQQPAAPPPVVVLPAAVASPSGGAVAVQQPALPPPVAVLSAALASPAGHAVPQAPQPAAPAAASASAQQAPATPPPPQPQTQPQQQKSRRSPQQQPRQQQADAQPIDHSPPAQQPGAFIADETEAALKVQILGAVQAIQQLGAVTSSELTDYIMHTEAEAVVASAAVAAAAAAAALMAGRADGSAGVQAGAARGGRPPGGRSQRGRGGAADAANPLKALLQASSMHELFAVLQASHQFVEVYDPRDKEKRLARAYRLHSRVKVPSPAELTANVRTLLQAEPTGEGPNRSVDEIVAHAVAVQQAKFGLLISAVASLTDAGAASAGRVREVMGLLGPATLTAWLGDRRRQMLQRYCLTRLVKEGALEVKDLSAGRCANLVRYRMAAPPPTAPELKAAHKVLKRVARAEAPPRHVPPPLKRACTTAAAGGVAGVAGPAASAGLRGAADVAAGGGAVPEEQQRPSSRLLRRIEEHHAILAPVLGGGGS